MKILSVGSEPFCHALVSDFIEKESLECVLSWLESSAPWRLRIAEFYEQYEFSFEEIDIPEEIKFLVSSDFLEGLKSILEGIFSVNLSSHVDVVAHKLVSGQRIRIHNDFIPEGETHRLVIQLNRGWSDSLGGLLILFGSEDSSDVKKIIRPISNSGIAFAISKKIISCGDASRR